MPKSSIMMLRLSYVKVIDVKRHLEYKFSKIFSCVSAVERTEYQLAFEYPAVWSLYVHWRQLYYDNDNNYFSRYTCI